MIEFELKGWRATIAIIVILWCLVGGLHMFAELLTWAVQR